MNNHIQLASAFAEMVHAKQTYGGHPYTFHLDAVEQVYADAGMVDVEDVLIAKLHDSIEDIASELRVMAVKFIHENFPKHVFDTVWAMTGIGENRKERNANYYVKIGMYPRSADYKVGDRIANMEHSRRDSPKLFQMYQKEDAAFMAEHAGFRQNVLIHAKNEILIARYNDLIG